MQTPPTERYSIWRMAGIASFTIAVALFMFVSSQSGMRWLGAVTLAGAIVQIVQRRIVYGWEGLEPTGFITGVPAVLLGILLGALGIAMLAMPDFMLVLLGWGQA